jgi:hypothetical protein
LGALARVHLDRERCQHHGGVVRNLVSRPANGCLDGSTTAVIESVSAFSAALIIVAVKCIALDDPQHAARRVTCDLA